MTNCGFNIITHTGPCIHHATKVLRFTIMNANEKRIKHEEDYIKFLENRLRIANFKKNVSLEEYEATEKKLKKAKLVLRMLQK